MDVETLIRQLGVPGTVIGAAIGYIGGIFTEPLKARLVNRDKRTRLRNALYSEMAGNLNSLLSYKSTVGQGGGPSSIPLPSIEKWLRTEVYEQASKTDPILFNEIKEVNIISHIYLALTTCSSLPPDKQFELMVNTRKTVAGYVADGDLSRRKLNRGTTSKYARFRHPLRIWVQKRFHI